MAEKVTAGPVNNANGVREAVCIHTKKIYSSCKDKDCIEDLRFYPTQSAQSVLASAQSLRGGSAELLYTFVDVEPVTFNRGYYTVDMRFYYKITLQAMSGGTRYTEVTGLATFGKRVILCGMDIRRPMLGRLFMLEDNDKGLTNLLGLEEVTESDVYSQIVPSGTDRNLDLLQAGPIPPNPTELLARESFGQVMKVLKKKYDYVVLDTAPVGLVTDALLIGCYADVTVFVCRAEYTPNYAIAQLNQLSVENRLPNTCFVLNGLN